MFRKQKSPIDLDQADVDADGMTADFHAFE
jgi:hypothetical protein